MVLVEDKSEVKVCVYMYVARTFTSVLSYTPTTPNLCSEPQLVNGSILPAMWGCVGHEGLLAGDEVRCTWLTVTSCSLAAHFGWAKVCNHYKCCLLHSKWRLLNLEFPVKSAAGDSGFVSALFDLRIKWDMNNNREHCVFLIFRIWLIVTVKRQFLWMEAEQTRGGNITFKCWDHSAKVAHIYIYSKVLSCITSPFLTCESEQTIELSWK